MKRHVVGGLTAMLLLSACAERPCVPKSIPAPYPVPTPVACVDASKVHPEPAAIDLDPDARVAADQAARQANTLRIWGRELFALVQPCVR